MPATVKPRRWGRQSASLNPAHPFSVAVREAARGAGLAVSTFTRKLYEGKLTLTEYGFLLKASRQVGQLPKALEHGREVPALILDTPDLDLRDALPQALQSDAEENLLQLAFALCDIDEMETQALKKWLSAKTREVVDGLAVISACRRELQRREA